MEKKTKGHKSRTKKTKERPAAKTVKEFSIPVYSHKGKEVGTFEFDKKLFTGKVNTKVIYHAVLMYNANQRQGTVDTKTRGEVSGGGKKPWRQKGTGRARAGSTRSPLWRHGGIVFGPHPRDYHYGMPASIKRAALLASVNSKLAENKIIGVESMTLAEPKTKIFVAILDALKVKGKSLVMVDEAGENLLKASRNVEEVLVKNYRDVNAMDMLKYENIIATKAALEKFPERFKA